MYTKIDGRLLVGYQMASDWHSRSASSRDWVFSVRGTRVKLPWLRARRGCQSRTFFLKVASSRGRGLKQYCFLCENGRLRPAGLVPAGTFPRADLITLATGRDMGVAGRWPQSQADLASGESGGNISAANLAVQ